MIETTSIETSRGAIQHLPVMTDYGVITAPAKVEVVRRHYAGQLRVMVEPVRRDGRVVYALPGGGEVAG